MKLYKQIDFLVSLTLILGFAVWYMYEQDILFTAYFVTGGWQVLSMIVHETGGWFTSNGSVRRVYHWTSLAIIALGSLSFVVTPFLFIFFIMLFAAPVMAVFYAGICYAEIKTLSQRPLNVLK